MELIVLDGASPDGTEDVMREYVSRHPEVRYIREAENSGVDYDYDKAVSHASADYVWLMTDDDLLKPDAVARVLAGVEDNPDALIVDAETWNADFSSLLSSGFINAPDDKTYGPNEQEKFFSDVGACASFIGCVIIRRSLWLEREREAYYGSLFIHVGVLFQEPKLRNTKVLASPLIRIRYGNAMWTSRGFEVWLFLWPRLIWSFGFSDHAKAAIYPREPWRMIRKLILYRALGCYSSAEYRKFLAQCLGGPRRALAYAVAVAPAPLVNLVAMMLCLVAHRNRIVMYDLARSASAGYVTRSVARMMGV